MWWWNQHAYYIERHCSIDLILHCFCFLVILQCLMNTCFFCLLSSIYYYARHQIRMNINSVYLDFVHTAVEILKIEILYWGKMFCYRFLLQKWNRYRLEMLHFWYISCDFELINLKKRKTIRKNELNFDWLKWKI